tara:strand:- start:866 stop:1243 length:378 start_codon:yes stop_codon:yes gene_type:complete
MDNKNTGEHCDTNCCNSQPEEDGTIAAITYLASEDSDDIVIDVTLADYDEKSTQALCSILKVLSSEASILQTINIIKDSLIAAGKEDILLHVLTEMGQIVAEKAFSQKENQSNDEKPCISPSDML